MKTRTAPSKQPNKTEAPIAQGSVTIPDKQWEPSRILSVDDLELPPELEVYRQSIKDLESTATHADHTISRYLSTWAQFVAWAEERGQASLPASPNTVIAFMASMKDRPPSDGGKIHLAAIAWKHHSEGWETPINTRCRNMVKALKRLRGETSPVIKAHPLTTDELKSMGACLERVPFRSTKVLELERLRLKAMVWTSWFLGRRLDEIVRSDESWLQTVDNGVVFACPSQKGQPEGHSNVLRPTSDPDLCPITALQGWIKASEPFRGTDTSRVTRLFARPKVRGGKTVLVDEITEAYEKKAAGERPTLHATDTDEEWDAVCRSSAVNGAGLRTSRALTKWCEVAGISPDRADRRISGHSTRRGLTTALEAAGVALRDIADHIGWASLDQTAAYSDHIGENPLEMLNL